MHLYLMRHAEATAYHGSLSSDAERPLTEKGRRQAKAIAEKFRSQNAAIDHILFSPLKRTRETAACIAAVLGARTSASSGLLPKGERLDLDRLLREAPNARALLVVAHHPDVGLLSTSLGGHESAFAPAAVAWFERQGMRWFYRERWIPDPL